MAKQPACEAYFTYFNIFFTYFHCRTCFTYFHCGTYFDQVLSLSQGQKPSREKSVCGWNWRVNGLDGFLPKTMGKKVGFPSAANTSYRSWQLARRRIHHWSGIKGDHSPTGVIVCARREEEEDDRFRDLCYSQSARPHGACTLRPSHVVRDLNVVFVGGVIDVSEAACWHKLAIIHK